jgi:cellulose synthase/poly-beta-1,6-N-acetylglucosamine synthase-like glycosyltransferase
LTGITVLVPVYIGHSYLEQLIRKLVEDPYPEKELVVCADAPSEETLKLEEAYPDVNFIFNEGRQGKVNSLNNAVSQTTNDFLLFLDSDIEIRMDNFLESVAKELEKHELIDIKKLIVRDNILARIVSYDYLSSSLANFVFNKYLNRSPQFNGAAFAIRRETFNSLGGFKPVICEDLEIAFKAYVARVDFSYADHIEVYNAVDPSLLQWFKQRIRWGAGLSQWIVGNFKDIVSSTVRNPLLFIFAFMMVFPSAPLMIFRFIIPDSLQLKEMSLILLALSSLHIFFIPSVYVASLILLAIEGAVLLLASFILTGIIMLFAARRLGFTFNPLEYAVYFLVYNPLWFMITLVMLFRTIIHRVPRDLDWKV